MNSADTQPLTAAVSLAAVALIGVAFWYGTGTYDKLVGVQPSLDPQISSAPPDTYETLFGRMQVELPERTLVASLGAQEKTLLLNDVLDRLAQFPPWVVSEPPPADEAGRALAAPVAEGGFSGAGARRTGHGRAVLHRLPDGTHLLRFEDFHVSNGADLHVYLTADSNVASAADLQATGTNLGQLKANVGNQNYAIPGDIAVGDYHGVVIYCELFDVPFSAAALR